MGVLPTCPDAWERETETESEREREREREKERERERERATETESERECGEEGARGGPHLGTSHPGLGNLRKTTIGP